MDMSMELSMKMSIDFSMDMPKINKITVHVWCHVLNANTC